MKQRTLHTKEDLAKAATDLLQCESSLPLVMSLTEGKRIRTEGQNARYWASIKGLMDEIANAVQMMSDETGHTPLEIKRIIAQELPPEHAAILFVRKSEAVHDILKEICGIPTSTRLGTKAFSKFDERLNQVMAEIVGSVNGVAMRALT